MLYSIRQLTCTYIKKRMHDKHQSLSVKTELLATSGGFYPDKNHFVEIV